MPRKQADGSEHALCSDCADDAFLKQHIHSNGSAILCSECGEIDFPAITADELANFIEPKMREHFEPGPDPYGTGQEGDELAYVVYEVVGQELSFEQELTSAVMRKDNYMPSRGEEAYWDETFNYVRKESYLDECYPMWLHALDELKYGRRFYSPAAKTLFDWIFEGLEDMRVKHSNDPVAYELPAGKELFRARVAHSDEDIKAFLVSPFEKLGPPPKESARAGRMNAEGVSVLYCALESDTCLAEMRPSIASELGVIALRTTTPLRVLDFSRLEKAKGEASLSFFHPDFERVLQKSRFLQMLHHLISQAIAPGHETDYLITQTMAEYLAHVHVQKFDGILFRSSQIEGGMNLVLFPDPTLLFAPKEQEFRVQYQAGSIKFHKITAVKYKHHDMNVISNSYGGVYKQVYSNLYDEDDDSELREEPLPF